MNGPWTRIFFILFIDRSYSKKKRNRLVAKLTRKGLKEKSDWRRKPLKVLKTMEIEILLDLSNNMHTAQLLWSYKIVCCETECIQDTSEGERKFSILCRLFSYFFLFDATPLASFLSWRKQIVWRGVLQRVEQAQSDYEFPFFHTPEPHFLLLFAFSIPEPA